MTLQSLMSLGLLVSGFNDAPAACFGLPQSQPVRASAPEEISSGARPDSDSARANKPDFAAVVAGLKRDVPTLVKDNGVPGAAIALVDNQALIWAGGFGSTNRRANEAVTDETLFSLQSVTKTYTATAFLMAVGRKQFTLDQPLRNALSDFRVRSTWGEAEVDGITFRHLLCHRGGLCHEAPIGNNYGDWHCRFDEHVQSISATWVKCPLGKRFRYSNLGYDLVAAALQLRTGKPFPRFMREELLEPLGMLKSTFEQTRHSATADRARGHIEGKEVPPLEIPMLGAGGMYSSAREMAKFISFQLSGGVIQGRQLIPADLVRALYAPQFTLPGQTAGYAFGVNSRPFHGATLVFHGGGGYGYSTDQRWVPEYGVGVVVLTNGAEGDNFVSDLADRTLQAMILAKQGAVPPDDPLPWTKKPVIATPAEDLKRLEGTYLVGSQLTGFRLEAGRLHIVRGKRSDPLGALSTTQFVRGGDLYEFVLDDRGAVQEVRNHGDNGVSCWVPNDSPRDPPGLAKPEWTPFLGVYHATAYGQDVESRVTLKNGSLYWNDRLKLKEYRPGLFFTADGDSVEFGRNTVEYGNRHFQRLPGPNGKKEE